MKNQLNEYKKLLPSLHYFRVSVGMAYNVRALCRPVLNPIEKPKLIIYSYPHIERQAGACTKPHVATLPVP